MPLFTLFLAQPARRRLPVRTCLGALVAAALGAGTAGTTMAAEVDTAQPELLCTLRMAAQTRLVRIGMQTDPYAPVGVAIGEQRFQFRAILNAGAPAGRASASITVSDLESESAPLVLQHASWSVSMAPSPALLQSSDT